MAKLIEWKTTVPGDAAEKYDTFRSYYKSFMHPNNAWLYFRDIVEDKLYKDLGDFKTWDEWVVAKVTDNGLHTTVEDLKRYFLKIPEAVKFFSENVKPQQTNSNSKIGIVNNPKGSNQYKKVDDIDNVNVIQQPKTIGGNSPSYKLARLKRDHPEIAQRVINDPKYSANAGAIEAGFMKKKLSFTIDHLGCAKLYEKLSEQEKDEFLRYIKDDVQDRL